MFWNRAPVDRAASIGYARVNEDCFLAVIFRRKQRRASKRFRRAVIVGQVLTLLMPATVRVLSELPLSAGPAAESSASILPEGPSSQHFSPAICREAARGIHGWTCGLSRPLAGPSTAPPLDSVIYWADREFFYLAACQDCG